MKTNAIVRIVLFSLAIVMLLGILLCGLYFRPILNIFRSSGHGSEITHTPIPESAESSGGSGGSFQDSGGASASASTSKIRELDIEWIAGTITIQPGDVDTITCSETEVSDAKYQMVVKESGDKLTIQYCKESISFPSFGINITGNLTKDLTITVPRDCILDSLDIGAASASVEVRDLTIRDVDFDGASGTCTFVGCNVDELDIDTASGDITFSGTLRSLDCDAASASFRGELTNTPSRISMDSMSGDLDITLPAGSGFTLSLDAMSSDFSSDFPTTMSGGNYVCGNGSCRISVNAMSGDVTIRKGP